MTEKLVDRIQEQIDRAERGCGPAWWQEFAAGDLAEILTENKKLRSLVKLGDFSALRTSDELFKFAVRIKHGA